MRIETTSRTLYTLDELSATAQERAIENIGSRLCSDWFDPDPIAEVIVYGIADALHAPGWDTFGSGDFPGVDGFTVTEWDVDRRSIRCRGVLYRHNAPALPWVDGIDHVEVGTRDYGYTHVVTDWDDEVAEPTEEQVDAMRDAVEEAMERGIDWGVNEYEAMASEENVREMIYVHEYEFTEEGDLA